MTALYVIIATLFFGVLVIIHEYGHFITAKAFGINVAEFSVGFGPALVQKEKNGTLISLRGIPFGGYCAMGEDDGETDDPHAFQNQKVWKRFLVLFAGSFMNFVLGFLIILVLVLVWNWGQAGLGRMLAHSFNLCGDLIKMTWESLAMLVNGEAGVQDLSGPVGIVDIMAQSASSAPTVADAVSNFAYLGAFIAVNIAVMNLLPIPALDGDRIFLMLVTWVIESITHKKLDPKYEAYIHTGGMLLLLLLMFYVMFHDIVRVFFGG